MKEPRVALERQVQTSGLKLKKRAFVCCDSSECSRVSCEPLDGRSGIHSCVWGVYHQICPPNWAAGVLCRSWQWLKICWVVGRTFALTPWVFPFKNKLKETWWKTSTVVSVHDWTCKRERRTRSTSLLFPLKLWWELCFRTKPQEPKSLQAIPDEAGLEAEPASGWNYWTYSGLVSVFFLLLVGNETLD